MRIAVVGGGIAGLSAAWALSSKHDVVLFEKDTMAGGHARTIDVPGRHHTQRVDFGFLLLHPWHYPNLLALLRQLGVTTRAVSSGVRVSANFADGSSWSHGVSTELSLRFQSEIARFHQLMRDTMADPASSLGQTLGEHLALHNFSAEFQEKFVGPLLSMLFVTRFGALDIGQLSAAICFGPVPVLNLAEPTSFETIEGGSCEYVSRLASEIGEVRLNCPVHRIERGSFGVKVHTQDDVEAFDHLILATDAETSLQLLDEPTRDEQQLLGEVSYDTCRMVVHTDPSVMPSGDDDWAAYSFMAAGCHPGATSTYSNYYLPRIQSWIEGDIFATANPPDGLIDSQTVIYNQPGWKHQRCDLLQYLRAAEMYRIQGVQRTWHCGSHVADSAWHEGSLRTGLAVAAALGADYPFPNDVAARNSFYDMAVNLMRVLPKRMLPSTRDTIWPPQLFGTVRRLTRDAVLDQISEKLRLGLPEPLFHRASPLAWARAAIARCIEPRISPYQEFKKTFRRCELQSGGRTTAKTDQLDCVG